MASKKSKKNRIKACVWMEVEVDEDEWMDRYGDYIRKNSLVPSVTLANAVKKQAHKAMENLELESLKIT